MLIEFSVQNHRAFRERQTFTMAASSTTERAGHGHVLKTEIAAVPYVLSEACLFGANGSGKSSLIDAMSTMQDFVKRSGKNSPSDKLKVKPFRFHSDWRALPSEFEIVFLHEETIYQYGFSLNSERIIEEWLLTRPKSTGRERSIFSRIFNEKNREYDWQLNAAHLKGERDSWRSQTLHNALFISTAVRLNAKSLMPPFEWITKSLELLNTIDNEFRMSPTFKWLKDEEKKKRIIDFLREIDVDLSDLHLEEKDIPPNVLSMLKALYENEESGDTPDFQDLKLPDLSVSRTDNNGELVPLALDEESTGTKALVDLSGSILDVLDHGRTLIVDELNTGLHPLAFQHLISLFASPRTNPKGAQLIFTSHDTSVADQECLGRDQIWLVEKGKDLAARLIPLSDFKGRDAKAFQKKYLDGRFGGIPRLSV
ncbi:AAA family ATPase [Altericroceibacterium endophyticum]|uniref:AAA family ATPase n=1 Tax=Altericroceibacterium endophyticum TaxID=1808508 RepID=A0A6I4T1L5_9SPHN|nr:ATP-binding protein [Altericroceibacterium endophyticum]MXO64847.1 AAA family ATPase [Altericroceibacterium endophyticum]